MRIISALNASELEEKTLLRGIDIISVDKKIIPLRIRLPKSHFSLFIFVIVNAVIAVDRYRLNGPINSNFDVGSVK